MADTGKKRGPEAGETPAESEKTRTEKRLPEYSSREEEALEEGYLNNPTVTTEQKTVAESKSNGLEYLKQGTALLKYTRRNGIPHFKWVQLSQDHTYLRWYSKKKKSSASTIKITEIKNVLQGQKTEVFARSKQPQLEVASFSIVYGKDGDTFDCVAKGQDECTLWVETLSELVKISNSGGDVSSIETIETSVNFMDRYRMNNRQHLLASAQSVDNLAPYILKTLTNEINKAKKKHLQIAKKLVDYELEVRHPDCRGLSIVVNELKLRQDSVYDMCRERTSEKIARSDVWRLNVDMDCILEKIEVCNKEK